MRWTKCTFEELGPGRTIAFALVHASLMIGGFWVFLAWLFEHPGSPLKVIGF